MKLWFPNFRIALLSFGLLLGGSALAAGCGGDDNLPVVDCSAQVPTFTEVSLLSQTCVGCHDSTLSGADRGGAPADINFDQFDSAKANAEAAVSAVYAGSMPPGGANLPADMKQQLYSWGLCGTPQ